MRRVFSAKSVQFSQGVKRAPHFDSAGPKLPDARMSVAQIKRELEGLTPAELREVEETLRRVASAKAQPGEKLSFERFLMTMPDVGADEDFEGPRDLGRTIDFSE